MRLQTKKGYEKSGVVKKPSAKQGSYVVQTGVKEYRRNRKRILAVPEPAPAQSPAAASSPTLLATALQQPPTLSNAPHQGPTMSNEDIFPEFAISAKTPSERGVYQTSPTRKFIRSKASLQSFLERGTPEVSGSNGLAYSNAKRSQVVTRSERISRPYLKSKEFVT